MLRCLAMVLAYFRSFFTVFILNYGEECHKKYIKYRFYSAPLVWYLCLLGMAFLLKKACFWVKKYEDI